MNLKIISDIELHDGNITVAKEEREILTRMLHRLRETERRRLFSKYKCQSLFEYTVKFLKYSNDQAERRIKAMRVLFDVPEIEEKINSGALTLTNLALAQKLFVRDKTIDKQSVLNRLENQTTRAAEKIVFEIRPEMKPKTADLEFHKIEDETLRNKLLQVKGLFAHTHPNMNLTELLHKLCDQEIEKRTIIPASKVDSRAEITRAVFRRDQCRCTDCGSTHAVQVEHIIPKAMGGPWTLENLRLLCRTCNQRRAIEVYGIEKMGKYLRSPGVAFWAPRITAKSARSVRNRQTASANRGPSRAGPPH